MRGAKIIPPTENIKAILQKLGDLPQEARKEAQTIAELQSEIVQLRRHKCEKGVGPANIERAVTTAIEKRDREWKVRIDKERQLWKMQVDNLRFAHF